MKTKHKPTTTLTSFEQLGETLKNNEAETTEVLGQKFRTYDIGNGFKVNMMQMPFDDAEFKAIENIPQTKRVSLLAKTKGRY